MLGWMLAEGLLAEEAGLLAEEAGLLVVLLL